MAHYRKIDIRIWLDQKFNGLSSDSQFVFLYLLTHPQLTALGAMRSTLPGLASELGWPLDRFEAAFEALAQQEMVAVDQKACFVWAMNFLKYNPPESPNVVKSWGTCLEYLPECDLKNQLIQKTRSFLASLAPSFQEALPDCFVYTTSIINNDEAAIDRDSNLPVTLSEDLSKVTHVVQASHEVTNDTTQQNYSSCNLKLSATLPEDLPKLESLIQVTLTEALPKGFQEELPEAFQEAFQEAFAKTCLNHRALNIKHKTLSIKQEQKEKELLLENNLEEKIGIEEIKNIVAKTRQKNAKPPDVEVVDVFSYWKETMKHPQAVLDAKRRKRIRQALASGYNAAQLREAILGCSYTPHNMGHNEQGQRYDSVHVIFRDADQIDRFIRNAHSPPRLQNAADKLFNSNIAAGQRWLEKKLKEQGEKTIHECT